MHLTKLQRQKGSKRVRKKAYSGFSSSVKLEDDEEEDDDDEKDWVPSGSEIKKQANKKIASINLFFHITRQETLKHT